MRARMCSRERTLDHRHLPVSPDPGAAALAPHHRRRASGVFLEAGRGDPDG